MAIIYSYPKTKKLKANDRFIVSQMDDQNNPTRTATMSQIADFVLSAPQGGIGTTNYVVQFTDGPLGLIGDSPAFTFDGGAGLKQFILTDGYRFVVDRDAATTVGDPEYAITQNGVNKTSFGWDDDGGGFGFIYNWAGKGFKLGGTALYPHLELLTDPDLKIISFSDFEVDGNISTTGDVEISGIVEANADVNIGGDTLMDGNAIINGELEIQGDVTAESDISLGDNRKLKFGDSNDLQIYHDGSDSYIDEVGTGDLIIQGALSVNIKGGGVQTAAFSPAGFVATYGGTNKISTSLTGFDLMQAGDGIKLISPDGLTTKTISIDNAGNLVVA
jgi:hypothetical protein|tara:strand:+ start:184 stop:1179 length:996 start_codon:yes stop_codon:yes gene_type:complete